MGESETQAFNSTLQVFYVPQIFTQPVFPASMVIGIPTIALRHRFKYIVVVLNFPRFAIPSTAWKI